MYWYMYNTLQEILGGLCAGICTVHYMRAQRPRYLFRVPLPDMINRQGVGHVIGIFTGEPSAIGDS